MPCGKNRPARLVRPCTTASGREATFVLPSSPRANEFGRELRGSLVPLPSGLRRRSLFELGSMLCYRCERELRRRHIGFCCNAGFH